MLLIYNVQQSWKNSVLALIRNSLLSGSSLNGRSSTAQRTTAMQYYARENPRVKAHSKVRGSSRVATGPAVPALKQGEGKSGDNLSGNCQICLTDVSCWSWTQRVATPETWCSILSEVMSHFPYGFETYLTASACFWHCFKL